MDGFPFRPISQTQIVDRQTATESNSPKVNLKQGNMGLPEERNNNFNAYDHQVTIQEGELWKNR
jgi:hypothetical protein